MTTPRKPLAWSHSSLTAFETCPRKYFHIKVIKDTQDPPGEAAMWGQTVHKHLEERAKNSKPLPDYLGNMEPTMQNILSKEGKILVEEQIALTRNLTPTGWFAKDVWCRGIVDIGIVGKTVAWLGDYKSGKRKPDNDQMKLFAAFSFKKYPWVEKITTSFLWIKDNATDTEIFTREKHEAQIWQEIMPRVVRMEQAFEKDSWPAKPSGLCSWCPVKSCEFWTERKR